jgi:hypothetical protein
LDEEEEEEVGAAVVATAGVTCECRRVVKNEPFCVDVREPLLLGNACEEYVRAICWVLYRAFSSNVFGRGAEAVKRKENDYFRTTKHHHIKKTAYK